MHDSRRPALNPFWRSQSRWRVAVDVASVLTLFVLGVIALVQGRVLIGLACLSAGLASFVRMPWQSANRRTNNNAPTAD